MKDPWGETDPDIYAGTDQTPVEDFTATHIVDSGRFEAMLERHLEQQRQPQQQASPLPIGRHRRKVSRRPRWWKW